MNLAHKGLKKPNVKPNGFKFLQETHTSKIDIKKWVDELKVNCFAHENTKFL